MLPEGLSMLWETHDPGLALADRFGFRDRAHVRAWLADTLAEVWGLDIGECDRLVISDHNAIAWATSAGHGPLVIKWSMEAGLFDRLHATTTVLSRLAEAGAPVASPVPSREGAVRVVVAGPRCRLSLAVLPEVSGQWLDTSDLAAVEAAGRALADLHGRLGELSEVPPSLRQRRGRRDRTVSSAEGADLKDRIAAWLGRGGDRLAPEAAATLRSLVEAAPAFEDAPQLIHRDFRSANILVDGSAIAAILDFDEMTLDHRILDLARSSVYLGTRFRNWAPTERSAQIALMDGYESVRALSDAEAAWWPVLLLWQSIAAVGAQDPAAGWAEAADALARESARGR
jgi:homoserine kinase type II